MTKKGHSLDYAPVSIDVSMDDDRLGGEGTGHPLISSDRLSSVVDSKGNAARRVDGGRCGMAACHGDRLKEYTEWMTECAKTPDAMALTFDEPDIDVETGLDVGGVKRLERYYARRAVGLDSDAYDTTQRQGRPFWEYEVTGKMGEEKETAPEVERTEEEKSLNAALTDHEALEKEYQESQMNSGKFSLHTDLDTTGKTMADVRSELKSGIDALRPTAGNQMLHELGDLYLSTAGVNTHGTSKADFTTARGKLLKELETRYNTFVEVAEDPDPGLTEEFRTTHRTAASHFRDAATYTNALSW